MDGRGRYPDNIFVECLWRTVKVEDVYLRDYDTVTESVYYLGCYFKFYNYERLHESLGHQTPAEVYFVVWRDNFFFPHVIHLSSDQTHKNHLVFFCKKSKQQQTSKIS
jgi:hypothetical protein